MPSLLQPVIETNISKAIAMPQFSQKEVRVLLIIGIVALILGLAMAWIGSHCLAKEIGAPEYLESLHNSGITLSCLALLWTVLAGYRKTQRS
jgi:predicted acyltransferase